MRYLCSIAAVFLVLCSGAFANTPKAQRIPQFSNAKVTVWETIIYPHAPEALKMHRHDSDRVVVALDSGVLKITSDKKKVHYLKLVKNKAYYLTKDIPGELHADENIGKQPLRVMVIQLNQ